MDRGLAAVHHSHFLQILLLCWCTIFIESKLHTALILPHGDAAIDPTLLPQYAQAAGEAIARGARTVARQVPLHANIFLSTPHGIMLSQDYGLYLGKEARGSVVMGEYEASNTTYTLTLPPIKLDLQQTQQLIDLSMHISGISYPIESVPLFWAEVIPLFLIGTPVHRKHMILSHPLERYTNATAMIPSLLQLEAIIRAFLDEQDDDWAVVVSGDLSHTHRADGPYGYSPASAQFDAAIETWARDPCLNADALLETARDLQADALSCGFTGLVWLHGVLCSKDAALWTSHVAVNRNATYFGMVAASFHQEQLYEME